MKYFKTNKLIKDYFADLRDFDEDILAFYLKCVDFDYKRWVDAKNSIDPLSREEFFRLEKKWLGRRKVKKYNMVIYE